MESNTGINQSSRQEIANGLSTLLADSYALYLKTQNFHWNVTGNMFQQLHLMFEGQYTDLAMAVDLIAERIRSLNVAAPGSFSAFSKLTSIADENEVPHPTEMLKKLISGHETVIKNARTLIPTAERAHDQATVDMLTQRLRTHEKTVWMLRATLGD